MGHKEQLLAGAKQCLYAKGYAKTTARDIVTASGTNLASIGYHYGSKEELLTEALVEAVSEWSAHALGSVDTDRTDPLGRFEEAMNHLVRSYPESPTMLRVNFEALTHLERPELRERLAAAHAVARRELAALVLDVPSEAVTEEQRSGLGGLLLALLPGTMAVHLVDPGVAPDGTDLVAGLRALLPDG
ncbi:TetR/AcrR family transcriptional regulator [Nocardiopsis sp. MG754419]|uniref:TetR/AcrR family transcriptional regulator n=1 Tax=Nocardiopsis sp. MG754419 TaxID=2259865 RepID=UPI001BA6B121|nr:TetR/AcrR family transcriptional regulator [Nocardiopsis sp. MG754419]MBR8742614.1 TetR/AcrR family transcriptional regulator [Nocardiopsis sp. MG754419]